MKYALEIRLVHWLRALVVLGVATVGLVMVNVGDEFPGKFDMFYPNHKQFGVLALVLTLLQLVFRARTASPPPPAALKSWEKKLSKGTHYALYVLLVLVPLMGYSMSSTFTQSDGVPFFFTQLPELLAKNDQWFEKFQLLHRWLAWALVALIGLHIAGAVKHRIFDKDPEADVLKRML